MSARSTDGILDRTLAGDRLSAADAVTLLEEGNLLALGAAANEIRNRKNDPSVATYIVDRNINYTNVCVYRCQFCAFYRPSADHPEAYVLSHEQIGEKIQETIDLGGTGVLLQGGVHADLPFSFYEDMFRYIRIDLSDDPPPRALGARGLLPAEDHEVADARRHREAEGRRSPVDPGRRRRDPRGLGPKAHLVAHEGPDGEVGRRPRDGPRPRHAHDGHDDVRRGGDLRRSASSTWRSSATSRTAPAASRPGSPGRSRRRTRSSTARSTRPAASST